MSTKTPKKYGTIVQTQYVGIRGHRQANGKLNYGWKLTLQGNSENLKIKKTDDFNVYVTRNKKKIQLSKRGLPTIEYCLYMQSFYAKKFGRDPPNLDYQPNDMDVIFLI
jgi:hypothetical protein